MGLRTYCVVLSGIALAYFLWLRGIVMVWMFIAILVISAYVLIAIVAFYFSASHGKRKEPPH
ncbi:MAG: hypothetical protein JRJ12_06335 [Deltaproteobacteria bacterium]|nr:hypothetical protein [Deltaproteobacteria bacterium]